MYVHVHVYKNKMLKDVGHGGVKNHRNKVKQRQEMMAIMCIIPLVI